MKKFVHDRNAVDTIHQYRESIEDSQKIEGSYETQYRVVPWREEDDLNLSPFLSYREAQEAGKVYYPDGFDIHLSFFEEP